MKEGQADRRQFERWLLAEGGDNREELERLKKALPVILDECVTERQRKFMIHRFVEQKKRERNCGDVWGEPINCKQSDSCRNEQCVPIHQVCFAGVYERETGEGEFGKGNEIQETEGR